MRDIERLAREAGMNTSMWEYGAGSMAFTLGIEGVARGAIERFAALVRNEVLEEAATVSDQVGINALIRWKQRFDPFDQGAEAGADACSEAIRALKDKT
jgi:hypothetical protein